MNQVEYFGSGALSVVAGSFTAGMSSMVVGKIVPSTVSTSMSLAIQSLGETMLTLFLYTMLATRISSQNQLLFLIGALSASPANNNFAQALSTIVWGAL